MMGSCSVLLVYLIGKKTVNTSTALLAAICLSVFSVTLVHDVIGGIEPVTTFFLLVTIYAYLENQYLLSGVLWGIVSLCRTEFWIIGLAVITIFYLSSDLSSIKHIKPYLGFAAVYYVVSNIYSRRGISFFSLIQSPFITVSSQVVNILNSNVIYQIFVVLSFIGFIYVINRIRSLRIFPILVVALIYSGYMFITLLRYIQGTNFLSDLINFIFSSNSKLNIGPFRYSTMGIPFIFICFSYLILNQLAERYRKRGASVLILTVILTTIPIVSLYRPYEKMPVEYMEVADHIGSIYDGEMILCDNQIINYRLTSTNNIPASKIKGSWQFKDITDLERTNITLFIMTSITWDGAHVLYYKTNHTDFSLIFESEAKHIRFPWDTITVYVYRIEY